MDTKEQAPDELLLTDFSFDEIPEAVRDQEHDREGSGFIGRLSKKGLGIVVGGAGLLLVGTGIIVSGLFAPSPSASSSGNSPNSSSIDQNKTNSSVTQTVPTTPTADTVLGHFSYNEAPLSALKAISPDGHFKLRKKAADKFLQMQRDARKQGIDLAIISAFRTVKEQEKIFFAVKAQRGQDANKRAEVSAPPGYSEHHTGYAIDIGDGRVPSTNLNPNFEKTRAFQWLKKNAAYYSFELSFTPDNLQGVNYEPWHWRYVGDRESLETFYRAKSLKQPNQ